MDFINNKGKELKEKAKNLAEIVSLNGQISACEDVIKKNYMEIGKCYYEQYKDSENPGLAFRQQCEAIANAEKGIRALEKKIKETKGI